MGQMLERVSALLAAHHTAHQNDIAPQQQHHTQHQSHNQVMLSTFTDLARLPKEVSLAILSHLDPTDLYLASCVWRDLAFDELLWRQLCFQFWPYCSAYATRRCVVQQCTDQSQQQDGEVPRFNTVAPATSEFSYRTLFLRLDEARLTFNSDGHAGMKYLHECGLVSEQPEEIARFLFTAKNFSSEQKTAYLKDHQHVLELIIRMMDFQRQSLVLALRNLFQMIHAPLTDRAFLHFILDKFVEQFLACNPSGSVSKENAFLVCFSLIILSVDLTSAHITNKMSKREFIKNTKRATHNAVDSDLLCGFYDDIYLNGHIAARSPPDSKFAHSSANANTNTNLNTGFNTGFSSVASSSNLTSPHQQFISHAHTHNASRISSMFRTGRNSPHSNSHNTQRAFRVSQIIRA